MGDLSGGQMIKRKIRKAYGLVDERGTTFYEFGVMGSEDKRGEIKRIKEWFRSGIDAGVGNDAKMKGRAINYRSSTWS
jgi:heme oxygenase